MTANSLKRPRIDSIKQSLGLSRAAIDHTRSEETVTVAEAVMPRKGGSDVLQLRERETTRPKQDQVFVRVEAAGVSFAEVQMLRGRYFNQPSFPFVPGYDIVGIITDVGQESIISRSASELLHSLRPVDGLTASFSRPTTSSRYLQTLIRRKPSPLSQMV
ncbi:alcohol dehydrogenase catalytic domain-containing protein [Haladaptatus pallidirubidus]|uniref:Alcohol dehydrogenase-like N-terminal domain-containing protein n=1 Tax=Haladaptatus pallidirubidus TaxID=1008152 RepID=A0AAV3UQW5_9EURY